MKGSAAEVTIVAAVTVSARSQRELLQTENEFLL